MLGNRRVNWGEAVVPGLALCFAMAYLYQTWDGPPGALYWPMGVAGVLAVLWIMVIVMFVVERNNGDKEGFDWAAVKPKIARPAMILLGPAAYLAVIPFTGFSIGSFLFLLLLFRGLGGRSWVVGIAVGAGVTLFLHVTLIVLMNLSLPRLSIGGLAI